MIKPKSPELGVWKLNQRRRTRQRVRPTSDMLLEKYVRQQRRSVFQRLGVTSEKGLPYQERYTSSRSSRG
jgi:hypothetical protein